MKKLSILMFFLLCINTNEYPQKKQRYIDSLFTVQQIETNLVYATALELNSPYMGESSTTSTNLSIHVFQPHDDTLELRPMLVCFHGGAFVSGTKENDDMISFCKVFASKGYVTVTAQYRLGMNVLSNISAERSVYRAIQDGRALLRFLRGNADKFKISTEHIYLLGSSAGALISLHNLFMDKESERPAGSLQISGFTLNAGPDLGSLDAVGSYTNQSAQANGIISLWGALKDTTLIEESDSQIPVFLVHGTADTIVPFGIGSPFSLPTFDKTYGSQLIDKRLTNLSYPHDTYFVNRVGHEFYGVLNGMWNPVPNQYWYIIVNKVRDFLFNIHRPIAAFDNVKSNMQVSFTNKSIASNAWEWNFGDGNTSTEENPIHIYSPGTYNVTLTAYSSVHSADTISQEISIIGTSVNSESLPKEFALEQNYPNPFNPETTIDYELPTSGHVTLRVYDVLGREVATLVNEQKAPGNYKVTFDGSSAGGGLASGVYVYQMQVGEFVQTRKLLLIK